MSNWGMNHQILRAASPNTFTTRLRDRGSCHGLGKGKWTVLHSQWGSETERRTIMGVSSSGPGSGSRLIIRMRDRSKNRKPLQKGRNLSTEAIQAVHSLKRGANAGTGGALLEQALETKFRRLLKLDMIAVLRELLRQNQCYLALKVFEDIQKEYWYKPQISLYAELVSVLGSNGLIEEVELLFIKLKEEKGLQPDIEGFNTLLESLAKLKLTGLAMECFYLMKSLGCDPDKLSFKILKNTLQSDGQESIYDALCQEAKKYYGLVCLEEKEEITMISN